MRETPHFFFVFTSPRSGSHALWNFFCNSPYVQFINEPLNSTHQHNSLHERVQKMHTEKEKGKEWRLQVLNEILHSSMKHVDEESIKPDASIYIAIFHGHQLKETLLSMQDIIEHYPSATFAILHRKNGLDRYISFEHARQTNEWARTSHSSPEKESPPVSFAMDKWLHSWCRVQEHFFEYISTFQSANVQPHILFYEDLFIRKKTEAIERIFAALDIPLVQPKEIFLKQGKKPVEERIENYTEHKEFIDLIQRSQSYFTK